MIDHPIEGALIPLLLSLKVAFWATMLAGLSGIATGFIFSRRVFFLREFLDAVFTLPMVLPPTVIGYYLLVLIGRQGFLGGWLDENLGINLVFTWQGAVIAASVVSFPLVYKSARSAFEGVNIQYRQAAEILGKSEWAIFFSVSLPLAWRGILAGCLMAFARALGEFGATLMVAGSLPGRTQTVSVAIYEAVEMGKDNLANFLVLLTSVVCLVILIGSGQVLKSKYESGRN